MRKFQVSVNMKKESKHEIPHTAKDAKGIILQQTFEILADDEDDAKLKAKRLLTKEGYNEKLLHHATWTVSRLDHPPKC